MQLAGHPIALLGSQPAGPVLLFGAQPRRHVGQARPQAVLAGHHPPQGERDHDGEQPGSSDRREGVGVRMEGQNEVDGQAREGQQHQGGRSRW